MKFKKPNKLQEMSAEVRNKYFKRAIGAAMRRGEIKRKLREAAERSKMKFIEGGEDDEASPEVSVQE